MSDQSPLIVPLSVEALVVNDHVRLSGNAFFRAQMPYNSLSSCSNGQSGLSDNDGNFTSSALVQGVTASAYYNGVYLKWRMPEAFTHGTQDSANNKTTYPPVPNRWLIVRMSGPTASRQATAWIIESDYVWPLPIPTPQNASQVGSMYVGQETATGNTPVGIYIGRNVNLSTSKWTEAGTSLDLTAVAPGNPSFGFYQPQNNNVFSFIDALDGSPDQTLSYQVLGWFSASADDPLSGATADDFASILKGLDWTLATGTDPTLTAEWTLLAGSVCGVEWQTESIPPGGAPPRTSPVSIAVGNTSIEALTALVAAQAAAQNTPIDAELLEAFQLDLLDILDQPDGAALLEDKLLASFFQRFSGGYSWTIVDAEGVTDPITESELEKELAWLAILEQNQQALDAAIRTLVQLQVQMYVMWWKYADQPWAFQGTTSIPGLGDQTQLQSELDPTVAGSLAQQTAKQMTAIQAIAAKVPSGDSPTQLQKEIAAYGASQDLPASRVLKRSAAPTFYLPNNPVVLITGAGSSGIVDDTGTSLCRFLSQAVTGFTFDGQTITAETVGLSIPQPKLAGVTGAPWTPAQAKTLIEEFFFIDPANAAMVSAAIPHSTPAAVQAAMSDQANDLGVYPTGAVNTWTQNPWHPLLLLWQATYYPISYGTTTEPNWTFQDGRYVWNCSSASVEPNMSLSGLIQLSPTASFNMQSRILAFLKNNPYLPEQEAAEFKALLAFVQSEDNWDLLSQSLNGFNEQLRLGMAGVFIGPNSTALVTDPPLPALIGDVHGYPPGLGPIPMQDQDPVPSQFQPWRSGQFVFSNLLVVDEWGQALWPIDQFSQATETIYLPPDLAPVLTSDPVPFQVTAAEGPAVGGEAESGGPVISTLSPNLIQAGMATSAQIMVTITGTGFGSDSVVGWNATALPTTIVSDTQIAGSVPASYVMAPATNEVTVTSGGNTSQAAIFTVSPGAAIGEITPVSAVAGGPAFTLSVTGVGFEPQTRVAWNGVALTTTFVDATHLTAQVPASDIASPGTSKVTVVFGQKVIPTAPDSYIQLPPTLLQGARLDFDLLSAVNDSVKFGPSAPGADPICGWVLPNHLDKSIMAYDADGAALGEMSVGINLTDQSQVCWTPAPGSGYTGLQQIAEAIPHFGPFLLNLSQQTPATFTDFRLAIDETLWTTVPMGAVFDQSLAVLMGRPLAMVRAQLQFELDGLPYLDPSWQYTFAPAAPAITGYEFAIELGNVARLDDGLIGYFVEDNYTTFNIVQQAAAPADGYLTPIAAGNNYIYLPFDGATVTHVSMLIDPRAAVHATTAILPTFELSLPPQFVNDALAAMDITFRVNGVLTDQTIAGPSAPVPGAPTVLLPVPKEKTGTWAWLENDGGNWVTYATGPNDTNARLSTVPPVLRRGLLQLSSAVGGGPAADLIRTRRRRRPS